MKRSILAIALLISISSSTFAIEAQPKYGPKGNPNAVPLALSNEYFRENPAPGFWALISYYIPQSKKASCSAATLAMAVNAARATLPKTASDPVVTEDALMDQIETAHFKARVGSKLGYMGKYGMNLADMEKVTEEGFRKNGFPKAKVRRQHIENTSDEIRAQLLKDLKALSAKTFILANFNQKNFTDDAEVGHFAPIGAYDDKRSRVLILDPDREYYEPYWVSVDTLLKAMATQDSSVKTNRGYLVIEAGEATEPT